MELIKADKKGSWLNNVSRLPLTKQVGLLFGVAASVALGIAIVLWAREPGFGVLYSGLSSKDAVAITEHLQQQGVKFHLDETSGAIMVPSEKIHELRLNLAGAGLPQSAGVGFSILDGQQQFGTSQFMETARYHRALEGELALSIGAVAGIKSARVHLAIPPQTAFVRKRQEPSASVLVNLHPGRTLDEEQVAAITHLVASSIPNLEPARVTVVDEKGRLLSGKRRSSEAGANQEQFEYTRQVEESYISRIEDILAPVVGREGVRAQVAVDMDFTVTEQTQESFNPDLPARRSEQLFEQRSSGNDVQGVPGALSNQPPAAGTAPETTPQEGTAGATTPEERSVKRSVVNYELDRTISHSRMASGTLQRLSVAVVVDDRVTTTPEGQVVHNPRDPAEIERISALVKDAVGFNAQRGDTVNVTNVAFTVEAVEPPAELPVWKEAWFFDVTKATVAAIVVLVLLFLWLRYVMRNVRAEAAAEGAAAAAAAAGGGGGAGMAALPGGGVMQEDQLTLSAPTAAVRLPGPDQQYDENLNQARQMALQDPKRVAQVVKNWIASED